MEFMRGIFNEAQRLSLEAGEVSIPGEIPGEPLEFLSGGSAPDSAEIAESMVVPGSVRQRLNRRRDVSDADTASTPSVPHRFSRQGGGPLDELTDVTLSTANESFSSAVFLENDSDSVARLSERERECETDSDVDLPPPARRHVDGPARQESRNGSDGVRRASGEIDSPPSSFQAQDQKIPGHGAHRPGPASAQLPSQPYPAPLSGVDGSDRPPGGALNPRADGAAPSSQPSRPITRGAEGNSQPSLSTTPRPGSGWQVTPGVAPGISAGKGSSPASLSTSSEEMRLPDAEAPFDVHRPRPVLGASSSASREPADDAGGLTPTPALGRVEPAREALVGDATQRSTVDPAAPSPPDKPRTRREVPSGEPGVRIGRVEVVVEEAGAGATSKPSPSVWSSISSRRYMRRP